MRAVPSLPFVLPLIAIIACADAAVRERAAPAAASDMASAQGPSPLETMLAEQASVMPTVYRSGPYRAFFYSADPTEPPHVHVEGDDNTVKFWLDPVRLESNHGFAPPEVSKVEGLIRNNATPLLKAWYDFFAD